MKPIKHFRHANSKISLKVKIWLYFIMFTVVVFALLWIFLIFFLERFYEDMRVRSAAKSMMAIADVYNEIDRSVRAMWGEFAPDPEGERISREILPRWRSGRPPGSSRPSSASRASTIR